MFEHAIQTITHSPHVWTNVLFGGLRPRCDYYLLKWRFCCAVVQMQPYGFVVTFLLLYWF